MRLVIILTVVCLFVINTSAQFRRRIPNRSRSRARTTTQSSRPNCRDRNLECAEWADRGDCQSNRAVRTTCSCACRLLSENKRAFHNLLLDSKNQKLRRQGLAGFVSSNQPLNDRFRPEPSEELLKCQDAMNNGLGGLDLKTMMKQQNLTTAVEDLSFRRPLSLRSVVDSNVRNLCVPQLEPTDCAPNMCYHLSYRTFDGTCNNLERPQHGAAFMPYKRLLTPDYADGLDMPTGACQFDKIFKVSQQRVSETSTGRFEFRPTARNISRFLLGSDETVESTTGNMLIMQWGQLIAHDMAKTTLLPFERCDTCRKGPTQCVNAPTDFEDQRFGRARCIRIVRSSPVCGTGKRNHRREQLNENTAFLDASMIYGSSVADANRLRESRNSGFLRMQRFRGSAFFPPFNERGCRRSQRNCNVVFQAGDNRANMFVGLAATHAVFAREHNRIVQNLQSVNPHWSGNRLYQEARKIVGALIQHITYNEYLPKLFGHALPGFIPPYTGYKKHVDPRVANEFVAATFRLGHGMIQEHYPRLDADGQSIRQGALRFSESNFNTKKLLFEGGAEPILRGMQSQPIKMPQRLSRAITEGLFGITDLASINIQRGRDHGIANYMQWRRFCNLTTAHRMSDLGNNILEEEIITRLKNAYHDEPRSVDLYVGCMLEDPIVNAMIGPTLACLVAEQFVRLRDGDRFWYENPDIFTSEQRSELRKATFSRLLCDNGRGWRDAPTQSFDIPRPENTVPCERLPRIDLQKWKET